MSFKYFNVYHLIPLIFQNLLQGFFRLIALFIKAEHKEEPVMEPEVNKSDYSSLTKDQIKFLSDHFGLTEEEVIQNEDRLKDTVVYRFEELRKALEGFGLMVIHSWEQMKPEVLNLYQVYKQAEHEQKIAFFKKKKSQRKNWSKWKKRRKTK